MDKLKRMFLAIFLGVFLVLPSFSGAVTWCNMDDAGGNKARAVQQRSANAAAAFFQAGSTTFQMFAQIELVFAGKDDALQKAVDLSTQSTRELQDALTQLKNIRSDEAALKPISESLRKLQQHDFVNALERASIRPDDPIARIVDAGRQKGAEGLLTVCSETVEELTSENTAMGQVYSTMKKREVPKSQNLFWRAMAQWSEALARGRVVAALFASIAMGRRPS